MILITYGFFRGPGRSASSWGRRRAEPGLSGGKFSDGIEWDVGMTEGAERTVVFDHCI